MLAIALRALRSRRTQTVTLILLAALVAAAAVAAPFFVYASTEQLTVRDIAAAPSDERNVAVSHDIDVHTAGAAGLAQATASIPRVLELPGFSGVTGVRVIGSIQSTGTAVTQVSTRDDVCAHVTISGVCPSVEGATMISAETAGYFKLHLGDRVGFTSPSIKKTLRLRIVGIYQPRDPADPYWGQTTLAAQFSASVDVGVRTLDPLFVTSPTIVASNTSDATVSRDLIISPSTLSVRSGLVINGKINNATGGLHKSGYTVSSDFTDLINRIVFDTNQVFIAVALGAVEVVLFGWYALFLAIRATAVARRFDVGILKLRGVQRTKLWMLMTDQSLLPLIAGAPIGLVAGFLAARSIAGPVRAPGDIQLALELSGAGVILAVLGGLTAALIAERQALAAPVSELLRHTPSRRRGWRADVADLLMVVLAVAGVIEIRTAAAGETSALAVVAPGLTAFAVGLVTARLLVPLSRRAVVVARRGGHVRTLLSSTYLARRPGLDRLFALCTISVALCGYAIFASTTAAAARSDRSTLEVGAASVLTVTPVPALDLMHAVRAADPSGRYAMAATQIVDVNGNNVLAVDSPRLAAVLPASSVNDAAGLAAALRPAASSETEVTGSSLQLDVDASRLPPGVPVFALVRMIGMAGPVIGTFGPLRRGSATYTVATPACAVARPCELIGLALSVVPNSVSALGTSAPPGTSALFSGLRQLGPDRAVLNPALFDSTVRWRATVATKAIGPAITASPPGLSITEPALTYLKDVTLDSTAYLVTVPTPVPVVVSGGALALTGPGTYSVSPFGFDPVPVRAVDSVALLPRFERSGVLIDLDYAQALCGTNTIGAVSQVWLAADAPASVVAALRRQGLVTVRQQTIARQSATYANAPSVIGLRFEVLAGVVGVAIAMIALLLVGSVERRPRADELLALRRQGVTARAVRTVVIGEYTVLAGGSAVAGVIGAVVVRFVAGNAPVFRDGWHILARPPAILGSSFLLVVAVGLIALGLAATVATYQLVSAIGSRAKGGA